MNVTAKVFTCNGVMHDLNLLNHHIDHYLNLGINPKNYIIMLNTPNLFCENLREAKNICKKTGVNLVHVWEGQYSSDVMHKIRRELINIYWNKDDWVVHADADEFHEYPKPFLEFVKDLSKTDITAVQGVFVDRLDSNGILKEVSQEPSIDKQFPVKANADSMRLGAFENTKSEKAHGRKKITSVVKMMMYKKHLPTSRGGHIIGEKINGKIEVPSDLKYYLGDDLSAHEDILDINFRKQCPLKVHHYKWHSGVIEKLKERADLYKKQNKKFWKDSQKTIDAMEFNSDNVRIPLSSIEVF